MRVVVFPFLALNQQQLWGLMLDVNFYISGNVINKLRRARAE